MKLKRIGSNQTELELNNGTRVLFSYETPVAAYYKDSSLISHETKAALKMHVTDKIIVTKTKYSKTTTKHINKWVDGFETKEVDQSVLDELVGESPLARPGFIEGARASFKRLDALLDKDKIK